MQDQEGLQPDAMSDDEAVEREVEEPDPEVEALMVNNSPVTPHNYPWPTLDEIERRAYEGR
jgi:hypothetical protein